MSLNWNVADVANSEAICFYEFERDGEQCRRLTQSTENLIFLTMVVGMGSITEDNYKEFYKRVALYEGLRGPVQLRLNDGGHYVEVPYTLEDIRQHIGLRTNVSEEKPAAWRKRILESWEHDLLVERYH